MTDATKVAMEESAEELTTTSILVTCKSPAASKGNPLSSHYTISIVKMSKDRQPQETVASLETPLSMAR